MRMTAKFHKLLALLLMGSANMWAVNDPFPAVNFRAYQGSMILTAQVVNNGQVLNDAMVAVYCGDELRGKDYVGNDAQHPGYVYTTIWGNYTGNDQPLHFQVYDGENTYSFYPAPELLYTFNGVVGSTASPYFIDLSPLPLEKSDARALIARKGRRVSATFQRSFTRDVSSTVCLPFSISSQEASAYGTFYRFAGVSRNENEWIVTMTDATADSPLQAGTPYLFKPSATGLVEFSGTVLVPADATLESFKPQEVAAIGEWSFQGTYSSIVWSEGHPDLGSVYGFVATEYTGTDFSAGTFVKAGAGASIAPFRAYLKRDAASHAPGRNMSGSTDVPQRLTVYLTDRDGGLTAVGMLDTQSGQVTFNDNAWYSLDGRPLPGRPEIPGVYINGARKVVIR